MSISHIRLNQSFSYNMLNNERGSSILLVLDHPELILFHKVKLQLNPLPLVPKRRPLMRFFYCTEHLFKITSRDNLTEIQTGHTFHCPQNGCQPSFVQAEHIREGYCELEQLLCNS